MAREKRIKSVKAWVTPAMKEQLELFRAEAGEVVSMSDYLFEVIEQHMELRQVMQRRNPMRASKQNNLRSVGND
jgi:hypothetical protein